MTKETASSARKFLHEIWEGVLETGRYLTLVGKALMFWRTDPPVETVEDLARFAETRSKFISQISLFGYIKTRAGTKYTLLFTDDVYAGSIKIAQWEIYLASLTDLASYLAARIGKATDATPDEMEAIALHVVDAVLEGEDIPTERPHGFDDIRAAFRERVKKLLWAECAINEAVFAPSMDALVKWAPISDDLKVLDEKLVKQGMRLKWKRIRDQVDKVLKESAVMADWRDRGGI